MIINKRDEIALLQSLSFLIFTFSLSFSLYIVATCYQMAAGTSAARKPVLRIRVYSTTQFYHELWPTHNRYQVNQGFFSIRPRSTVVQQRSARTLQSPRETCARYFQQLNDFIILQYNK